MGWWLDMMPMEAGKAGAEILLRYQNREHRLTVSAADGGPRNGDAVMLLRRRVSRILYRGRLFDYPLSLSADTLLKLGLGRTARIGTSYLAAMARPIRPEKSLEDFLVNRFGRVLYEQFFKEYTEKVWGVACTEISPEWGAQRIKGLSIRKVLGHALGRLLPAKADLGQKGTETSLIERFLYPKLGPGQMWRLAAAEVARRGGEVRFGQSVERLHLANGRIAEVEVRDLATGDRYRLPGDCVVSTMPVQQLAAGLAPAPPAAIAAIAQGLRYRDFITVGMLVDRLELGGGATGRNLAERVPDNWIYVQEAPLVCHTTRPRCAFSRRARA